MRSLSFIAVALAAPLAGCELGAGLLDPGPDEIAAIVQFTPVEGGCWRLVTADNAYEPVGLPSSFRQNGRRVLVTLKPRNDLGSYCMVGRMAEVVSIRNR